MGLILNFLAGGAALLVSAFVYVFSSIPILSPTPEEPVIPVATLEAIGSTSPLNEQLEALIPAPGIIGALESSPLFSTSTAPKPSAPVPSITPPIAPILPPTPPPVSVPVVQTVTEPAPADAALAALARASVNIVCTGNGTIRGMSGSGVVISPSGVIMTVAHVAQYYLLLNHPNPGSIACTVRTGSPARAAYLARPLYVSEEWVKDNPTVLLSRAPKGSGEGDFAFLQITGSVSGETPSSFPYVPLSDRDPKKGDAARISAYPAQSLSSSQINSSLMRIDTTSSVTDRFTFDTTQTDVVSLAGNQAAQTGSSGAGVADANPRVFALITTSSTEGPYASRKLHAITANYVRRSFKEQTGRDLDSFLRNPTPLPLELSSLTETLVGAIGS